MVHLILLLYAVCYVQQCLSGGLMSPADVKIQYIQKCADERGLIDYQLKPTSKREGIFLSFNLTTPFEFSNNLTATIGISINSNGGWKANYYNAEFENLCSSLKSYEPELFQKLARIQNASNSCPLPKGHYSVSDYNLSKNKRSTVTDVYLFTKFKINIKAFLKKRVLMCFDIFAESVPKKVNKKGG